MNYTVIQPTTVEKPFPKLMTFSEGNIVLATGKGEDGFIEGIVVASTHLILGTSVCDKALLFTDFDGEVILKNS